MKRQRKILYVCLGVVGCLVLWVTVVSSLGYYYFWPVTTLDSEHVGVLVVQGQNAIGISVGTTRAAAPGKAIAVGTSNSKAIFSFYVIGDPSGEVASQLHIRRWPLWINYRDIDTGPVSSSASGWPCVWPPHFLRAFEIWRHNKTLLSDAVNRARER